MNRHKDIGASLTEIRTVLSRAKTARENILGPYADQDGRKWEWIDGEYVMTNPGQRDPDADEMIKVLDTFIADAEKWQRKGR